MTHGISYFDYDHDDTLQFSDSNNQGFNMPNITNTHSLREESYNSVYVARM